jgi:hypothetical protein
MRYRLLLTAAVVILVGSLAWVAAAMLQPSTNAEIAREHLDQVVDKADQRVARNLRGRTFTAQAAEQTQADVRTAVGTETLAVRTVRGGDDGEASWVELLLLSRYQRDGAGWVTSALDLEVSGCVRFAVTHGRSGWEEGVAEVRSRSVPCPDGIPLPAPADPAFAGSPDDGRFRVDDLSRHSYPIRPRPPACFSGGGGYCPGG